jgi:hypothetical protein
MTKRLLPFLLLPAFILAFLVFDPPAPRNAAARSTLAPASSSGAPSEGTCFDCHGLAENDGVGSISIAVAGLAAGGYVPGQVYDVTVTLTRTGALRWGFSLTALRNWDNAMAGSFTIGTDNFTNTRTGTVGGISRTWISHTTGLGADGTFAGTANGPVNWTFKWTAPAEGAGAVTLYTAGVAADNAGGADDPDLNYTTTKVIQEQAPTPVRTTTWGAIKSRYR